ncbi:MAG: TetR/AcrR family transcriptional regulator [Actinomycetota bacterium]|nr:TetR/AcrR family transcriptional regulator [Actinomycetota bacterium]
MESPTGTESPARRRLSAADRRAAILESALEVFSERGFSEASLDDVATRGGISKALIYEHFSSKRELQLAVLDTNMRDLIEAVVSAVAAVDTDEERLRSGIDSFLVFASERPNVLRLMTRNVSDPVAGEAIDRLREEAATTIASIMAQNAPELKPGDLDLETTVAIVAHLMAGGIQFLAGWWIDHPEIPRDRVVELAMGVSWIGLERLGQGARWGR